MPQEYNITSKDRKRMPTNIISKVKTLSNSDRCDRCGVDGFGRGISQAYVKATMKNGFSLYFCKHHGNQYIESLQDKSVEIIDERDLFQD